MAKEIFMELKQITHNELEQLWNTEFSPSLKESILYKNLIYTDIYIHEHNGLLLKVITDLNSNIEQAGIHRLSKWDAGWNENLNKVLHNESINSAVVPLYYGKYSSVRWKQNFINPINKLFELHIVNMITEWCFDNYIRNVDAFYEFGCGPGHNLLIARYFNSNAEIWGCDWSTVSQKIISQLSIATNDKKMFAKNFNFFNIDRSFDLKPNSAIFTLASLEQTGCDYENFIYYILDQKPSICIHIEPIAELLDQNNLLDYLSILYFKKRNYLDGFYNFLKKLENDRKIKIIKAQRTYTGSLMIEGHSIIIWKPT